MRKGCVFTTQNIQSLDNLCWCFQNFMRGFVGSTNDQPDFISQFPYHLWVLNTNTYTDIYDDIYLKRYATSLIKKQWGANLIKFNGVAMLGGVQLNGETIYSQAIEEITKLEEQIQLAFELPPTYMIGQFHADKFLF